MIRNTIYIICIAMITGCHQNTKKAHEDTPSYHIKGILKNYDGYVYLTYADQIDSSKVIHNEFIFTGSVKDTFDAHISLLKDVPQASLYLENSPIILTTQIDSLANSKFQISINSTEGSYSEKLIKEYGDFYKENSAKSNFQDLLYNKLNTFLKTHARHPFSGAILASNAFIHPILSKKQLVELYKQIDTTRQTRKDLDMFKRAITNLSTYAKGNKFLNFTLPNSTNTLTEISSSYSNFTLIDFWASWCIPCRKTIPKLSELKKELINYDFNIISISIDTDKNKWTDAITKDQMDWINLLDNEQFVYNELGIIGIPYSYLVNKEGTILEVDPSIETIKTIVKSDSNHN